MSTTERNAIDAGRRAMVELREIERKFRARKSVMMIAARGLYRARCRYHDNREFGRWLKRSTYAGLRPHEIASMLNLARYERHLAPFLKSTNVCCPVVLWRQGRRIVGEHAAAITNRKEAP